MTRFDDASDTTVPDIVAAAPLAMRVIPSTTTGTLPSRVNVSPARVTIPFALGLKSGVGVGNVNVSLSTIRPDDAEDRIVLDAVVGGPFIESIYIHEHTAMIKWCETLTCTDEDTIRPSSGKKWG